MSQWTRTHTEALGVYTRGICSPWPYGHVLTPWQTRYPGLPRAKHQASQEATGNSDPAWASQTRSGVCAGRARSRVGKHDGQWGGGVPTLPAWLCSPCGVSALKFPVEFSILWRNRGVGRGEDLLGSRPSPLLGPQPPPEHFPSCWKGPLGAVRVTSPVPSQGIFLTPLDLRSLPLSGLDHSAPSSPSLGAALSRAMWRYLRCVGPSAPLPPCVLQGAAPKPVDALITSSWAQWSLHLAGRYQGPRSP